MTEREIHEYLKTYFPKENEHCEWKAFGNLKNSISGSAGDDAISYVSAISNMEGGSLIMGVQDETLNILGIHIFHDYTPENLPQRLLGNCTNLPSEGLRVEELKSSDTNKTVWVLHIPKHMPRLPVIAHKKAWQRSGDSLIELTPSRRNAILNESLFANDDWSATICPDAKLSDLDSAAIAKARENYKNKYPDQAAEVDTWNDTTFLNKAKVTIKGKITRAAILLLGKPESEHFISPAEAKIRWILKDKDGVEKDYAIFSCPFLLSVDEVYKKIRNLKYRYLRDDTLFPEEVDQYEPYVIREAINNCIAHQDYTCSGRINVVEKDDELIFTNMGSFIPGSVENVIREDAPEEVYRNPFLAYAMVNFKMVDTTGSGIRRMFNYQRSRFFPMPEYDFSGGKVKLTITGKVLDLNYARMLARNSSLNLLEIMMLDKVQKRLDITNEELKLLRAKGLVEGKKPNIIISAKVAQTTGQKATYTKYKAFDNRYYLDLVINAINQHGSLSRKDVDELLLDKLSDRLTHKQKRDKIRNLLHILSKKEKSIKNISKSTKEPRWVRNEYKSDTPI